RPSTPSAIRVSPPSRLAPRHAPSVVLTGEEPPLQIAREPVRAVGRLEIDGHARARRVFHAPVVVDIGEQEVAALLPPQRPLGGSPRAAQTRSPLPYPPLPPARPFSSPLPPPP